MTEKTKYTVIEAVKYLGITKQRILQKLKKGHYPHSYLCECGQSYIIPLADLIADRSKERKPGRPWASDKGPKG